MTYSSTFGIILAPSQTGLTPEAQLKDSDGANVGGAITAGFFEVGNGMYIFKAIAIPDGHRGVFVFQISVGGAIKALGSINPEEIENTDVKTSTRVGKTDTVPEQSASVPPAVPTYEQLNSWFWMTWRNNLTASASEAKVRKDDGTVAAKAGLSDDGVVFSKARWVAGP